MSIVMPSLAEPNATCLRHEGFVAIGLDQASLNQRPLGGASP